MLGNMLSSLQASEKTVGGTIPLQYIYAFAKLKPGQISFTKTYQNPSAFMESQLLDATSTISATFSLGPF